VNTAFEGIESVDMGFKVIADVFEAVVAAVFVDSNSSFAALEPLFCSFENVLSKLPQNTLCDLLPHNPKPLVVVENDDTLSVCSSVSRRQIEDLFDVQNSTTAGEPDVSSGSQEEDEENNNKDCVPPPPRMNDQIINFKGILNEYCLKAYHTPPVYELEKKSGLEHSPYFVVKCTVANQRLVTHGRGYSKKDAQSDAASLLLVKLGLLKV